MQPDQLAPHDGRLPDSGGERLGPHAVLHSQHARLELFALCMMRALSGVCRHGAGLLGEGEIRVARIVGVQHCRIARERRRDAELLLRPIDISEAIARRRLDQPAQPHARAENELGIAWLIASCSRAERGEQAAIAAIGSNSKIGQAQLGQRGSQLAQRRHGGMRAGCLPEGIIAKVELAAV